MHDNSDHQTHRMVGIVFPVPTLAHLVPDPHCTLIYLGRLGVDVNFTRDQVLDVLHDIQAVWGRDPHIKVSTDGYDLFGPNKDIPVIRLQSSFLRATRSFADRELSRRHDIRSASEFEYRPHVTLSRMPMYAPPNVLEIHKPILWWGDER